MYIYIYIHTYVYSDQTHPILCTHACNILDRVNWVRSSTTLNATHSLEARLDDTYWNSILMRFGCNSYVTQSRKRFRCILLQVQF